VVLIESLALHTLVISLLSFYWLFRGSVDCMSELMLLGVGLAAGVAAGMFGIGGGLIIVPALIFLLGMKEKQAIGTSLAALIPPVGLLGAAEYYRNDYINIKYAALIAVGLFLGAYFGAKLVISMPDALIRRIYAIFLLAIATRMLIMGK
jgi:uncharacterized membrane protein YfcA